MRAIVLAGGRGTRLWPLSQKEAPKPFISLSGGDTLLQTTISRLARSREIESILLIGSQRGEGIRKQMGIPLPLSSLVEPVDRGTAPAICLAVRHLIEEGDATEEEVCLVSPSDLHFEKEGDFLSLLSKARRAAQSGGIVTFGVKPTYPETGYGYMRVVGKARRGIYSVASFLEKPDRAEAIDLIKEGRSFWHSGILLFQIGWFLKALAGVLPALFDWIVRSPSAQAFSSLPHLSFDRAFLEKSRDLSLVVYPSGWADLGSWERVFRVFPKDEMGNVTRGNVVTKGTRNTLVFALAKKVAVVGLSDLIVVETEDSVLVAQQGREGDVAALATSDASVRACPVETLSLAPGQVVAISKGRRGGYWMAIRGEAVCRIGETRCPLRSDSALLVLDRQTLVIENSTSARAVAVRIALPLPGTQGER